MIHLNAADLSALLNCPSHKLVEKSASLGVSIDNEAEVLELTTIAELIDYRIDCIMNCIGSVLPRIACERR